jgi:hypothetical protein
MSTDPIANETGYPTYVLTVWYDDYHLGRYDTIIFQNSTTSDPRLIERDATPRDEREMYEGRVRRSEL